jgi:hypothetical protein
MTTVLLENIKLVILFVLFGSIITLSSLGITKARPVRAKGGHSHQRAGSVRL